jgi:hypothetical protein
MSLEVFNKAKFLVDKIAIILENKNDCIERLTKSSISIKSCRFYTNQIQKTKGYNSFILFLDGTTFPYDPNAFYKFDGSGLNYNHRKFRKQLCRITEFDEAFDFQLQTLFDDEDLFYYYYLCLIHSTGYVGFVRKYLHNNTLNMLVKHSELMKLHKDSTDYPYTYSHWYI